MIKSLVRLTAEGVTPLALMRNGNLKVSGPEACKSCVADPFIVIWE